MARASRISKAQRAALARLSAGWLGSRVYLAGGVAIAWHFEHRSSRDLDLFSKSPRFSLRTARQRVVAELSDTTTVVASEAMLDVHCLAGHSRV